MTSVSIRLAHSGDDAGIRAFMRENPMPGGVSMAFGCEPSFFQAVCVQGFAPHVIVAERDGLIKGTGLVAMRRVFINGRPSEIGYLGSLRLADEVRGMNTLARGYRFLKKLQGGVIDAPFFISSVLEDNRRAIALLTSGRADLPRYEELGRYCTTLFPVTKMKNGRGRLRIRRGGEDDVPLLVEKLSEWGSEKQFFPVPAPADFIRGSDGQFKGLSAADFLLAFDGSGLVGCLALWDQTPFRQVTITRYSGVFTALKTINSMTRRLTRMPDFPAENATVKMMLVACAACDKNDPETFGELLNSALTMASDRKCDFIAVGLDGQDPLFSAVRRAVTLRLFSRIYAVTWNNERISGTLDGRFRYLELGSL